MSEDVIFWTLLPIIAWFLIGKDIYRDWYNKKHGIVEKKIKGKQLSKYKLIRMWQESYLYLVFVERNNRAFSQFIYVLTLIPFLIIIIIIIEILTPIIPLKDLPTDEGIAHVYINTTGRGTGDKLILYKGENNEIKTKYNTGASDEWKRKIDGKRVKIWYQHQWRLFWFEKRLKRLELDGTPLTITTEEGKKIEVDNYSYQGERINIKWWLLPQLKIPSIFLGLFLLWIFFLNYKEKPIHRLNRMKDKGITFNKNKKDK